MGLRSSTWTCPCCRCSRIHDNFCKQQDFRSPACSCWKDGSKIYATKKNAEKEKERVGVSWCLRGTTAKKKKAEKKKKGSWCLRWTTTKKKSRKEEERRKNIGNESQMFPFLFVANPHVLLTIPREAHGCDIICPSPSGQNATVRELEYHITGVVKPSIIHFNMIFHYKPPMLGNLHISIYIYIYIYI